MMRECARRSRILITLNNRGDLRLSALSFASRSLRSRGAECSWALGTGRRALKGARSDTRRNEAATVRRAGNVTVN